VRTITRSVYDQNRAPRALADTALNVRAHRERLPYATFRERQVLTMGAWDATADDTLTGRQAARARLAHARATFAHTDLDA
jgi:hypothetical protein